MYNNKKIGGIILTSVGERIKNRRKQLGMSQSQLAFKIDSDSTVVSRWETNKVQISQKYISKIAQALETSINYLLGETDNPKIDTTSPILSQSLKQQMEITQNGAPSLGYWGSVIDNAEKSALQGKSLEFIAYALKEALSKIEKAIAQKREITAI